MIEVKTIDELPFLENKLGKLGRRIVLKNINKFIKGKIKVIRIPLDNAFLTFYFEDKDILIIAPKYIAKEVQKLLEKEENYSLFLILSYIVEKYYQKLNEINKKVSILRNKLLSEELISLNKVLELIRDLEDLEDKVQILRNTYKLIISEPSYALIIEDEIFHLLDEIEETYNKITFLIQMQSEILQKKLDIKMERLTKVSMVFLPATLIAGIYGMNFTKVLPEWQNPYGFLIALTLIFLSSLLTYLWLR